MKTEQWIYNILTGYANIGEKTSHEVLCVPLTTFYYCSSNYECWTLVPPWGQCFHEASGKNVCSVFSTMLWIRFWGFVVVAWEPGSYKVVGLEPCVNIWAFWQCNHDVWYMIPQNIVLFWIHVFGLLGWFLWIKQLRQMQNIIECLDTVNAPVFVLSLGAQKLSYNLHWIETVAVNMIITFYIWTHAESNSSHSIGCWLNNNFVGRNGEGTRARVFWAKSGVN